MRAPASRTRWSIHLALITAYLLVVAALGWRQQGSRGPALSSSGGSLLMVSAEQLAIFGLVFGLAWLASRASRDDLLLRWRGGLWPVPLGLAYSVVLRVFAVGVMLAAVVTLTVTGLITPGWIERFAAANGPRVGALLDVSALRNDPLYYWAMLTLVSFVVAGLREELWRAAFLAGMRSLWPSWFGSRLGQIGAVAIAAVIFGLGHARMGAIAVLTTGILGFGLGLIMVLHRSIWPAVIAHGALDATTMALLPWLMDRLRQAL